MSEDQGNVCRNTELLANLEKMLNNETYSDTVFFVNKMKFYASSHLVSVSSIELESMLKIHYENCKDREIKMGEIAFEESFLVILRFMYGLEIDLSQMEKAVLCEVLCLAERFRLDNFFTQLKNYLSKLDHFELNSVVLLINTARKYKIEELYGKLKIWASQNADCLVKHDSFSALRYDVLLDLLKADYFSTQEVDILKGVLNWHVIYDQNKIDVNMEYEDNAMEVEDVGFDIPSERPSHFNNESEYIVFPKERYSDFNNESNIMIPKESTSDVNNESNIMIPKEITSDVNKESGYMVPKESTSDVQNNERGYMVPKESTSEVNNESGHVFPKQSTSDVNIKSGHVFPKVSTSDGNNESSVNQSSTPVSKNKTEELMNEFSTNVLRTLLSQIRFSSISVVEMHNLLEMDAYTKYKQIIYNRKFLLSSTVARIKNTLKIPPVQVIEARTFTVRCPSEYVFYASKEEHEIMDFKWELFVKERVKYPRDIGVRIYLKCSSNLSNDWECEGAAQVKMLPLQRQHPALVLPSTNKLFTISSNNSIVDFGELLLDPRVAHYRDPIAKTYTIQFNFLYTNSKIKVIRT